MTSLVEDNWEVVIHDVLISCCGTNCNLIESDPIFWVFLAVVLFKLLEFKVAGPYDLAKVRGKLS